MRKNLESLAKEILEDNLLTYELMYDVDLIVSSMTDEELKAVILGRWDL